MPSLDAIAVSAAAPLLFVVPKNCIRHASIGDNVTTGDTIPCIAKSGAELPNTSKTYHVPPLPPPQLTMRNVTLVPAGTFCSAAIAVRSSGLIVPPLETLVG